MCVEEQPPNDLFVVPSARRQRPPQFILSRGSTLAPERRRATLDSDENVREN